MQMTLKTSLAKICFYVGNDKRDIRWNNGVLSRQEMDHTKMKSNNIEEKMRWYAESRVILTTVREGGVFARCLSFEAIIAGMRAYRWQDVWWVPLRSAISHSNNADHLRFPIGCNEWSRLFSNVFSRSEYGFDDYYYDGCAFDSSIAYTSSAILRMSFKTLKCSFCLFPPSPSPSQTCLLVLMKSRTKVIHDSAKGNMNLKS